MDYASLEALDSQAVVDIYEGAIEEPLSRRANLWCRRCDITCYITGIKKHYAASDLIYEASCNTTVDYQTQRLAPGRCWMYVYWTAYTSRLECIRYSYTYATWVNCQGVCYR